MRSQEYIKGMVYGICRVKRVSWILFNKFLFVGKYSTYQFLITREWDGLSALNLALKAPQFDRSTILLKKTQF
jgi:hypothetical protein